MQQVDALINGLAHADNAPAAYRQPGLLHVCQRFKALVVATRADDLGVELAAGIEVMVVGVESGFLEPLGLRFGQHAQRAAHLQPQLANGRNHLQHFVEMAVVAHLAPSGAHAKAGAARLLGLARSFEHRVELQQAMPVDAGMVAGRLRTIGAVLGTAAGLHRQQCAKLHLAGRVVRAVGRGRLVDEFKQRRMVDLRHIGP